MTSITENVQVRFRWRLRHDREQQKSLHAEKTEVKEKLEQLFPRIMRHDRD